MALYAAVLALAFGGYSAPARADGDPASDVLSTQALFLPQDAGLPATRQAQLSALLEAAQRSGYQIRVALIASSADLGSITELWRQPQSYARFLGQELSLVYRGPLLVIMPGGFGLYRLGGSLGAEQSALAGMPPPTAGAGLGTAALAAIQRLAGATGHALPVPTTTVPSNAESTDTVSWIVLAVGAALIAVAWVASLRARPLRPRGLSGGTGE